MTTKKKFTKQQHLKNGLKLQKIRIQLLQLQVEVQKAYANSSRPVKLVERAAAAVDALRCELDNRLAAETTDADWQTENLEQAYYGSKEI